MSASDGGGGTSPATVCVKVERLRDDQGQGAESCAGAAAADGLYAEHEVKDDLLGEACHLRHQCNVTSAMSASDGGGTSLATVCVKVERLWDDRDESGAGAAAADGLYVEHEVKDELVLGPPRLQPQDIAYALYACPETVQQDPAEAAGAESRSPGEAPHSGEEPRLGNSCREHAVLRTCFVRLERCLFNKKLHPCVNCFKTFLRKSSLMTHICVFRARKRSINRVKSTVILNEGDIIRHTHLKNPCSDKDFRSVGAEGHVIHAEEKPFTCDICNKKFSRESHVSRHLLTHIGDKPFTCDICNKQLTRESYLADHLLIHTGEKSFTCEICDKPFSRASYLANHRLIHTGKKPFTCDVCKKHFVDRSTLARHRLTHSGKKSFTCDVCKKHFVDRSTLARHRLTHSGKKSFTCDVCKKHFVDRSTLARHRLTHSGKKSFTCDVCKKHFVDRSTLARHRLTHSGKKSFTCDVCQRQFAQRYTLARHRSTHAVSKPYSCDLCKKQFIRESSLAVHRLIHIGKNPAWRRRERVRVARKQR